MIGDGHCDQSCNLLECSWDGLDCGCAAQCDESDYGSCKMECLLPDCGYDSMPGFPACADEEMRFAFKITHEYFKSLDMPYLFEEFCGSSTPGCDLPAWRESFTSCVPACAVNEACLSSFRHCTPGCDHIANCRDCDSETCFQCEDGYLSFYDTCQQTCPETFVEHPLVPGLCTPEKDYTTHDSPAHYYVISHESGVNHGSRDQPFDSISLAFASVHSHYSHIYLLRGTHYMTQSLPSPYMRTSTFDGLYSSLPYSTGYHLEVKPLYCTNDTLAECVEDAFATVKFDNLNPVYLHLRGHVEFWRVHFEGGTSLVEGCTSEVCTYCPKAVATSQGTVDDRQRPLLPGFFAPQSTCDSFHSFSLISVEPDAEIEFYGVAFANFRQQLRSIIEFTTGSLRLENATFSNVVASGSVILQTGTDLLCNITLTGGTVELLNNGYEYAAGRVYSGFLSVQSADSVLFEDVGFALNNVGVAGNLIQVNNVLRFRLSQCQFESNLGRIVSIDSTITIPRNVDSGLNLVHFHGAHFSISDTNFTSSSGESLIAITFSGDLQNVAITNTAFQSCLSAATGLVSISSTRSLRQYEISGQQLSVIDSGRRVRVVFPCMWVHFSDVSFTHTSLAGSGLIFLSNLANVVIERLTVSESGESQLSSDFYVATLQAYVESEATYMSRPAAGLLPAKCAGLVVVQSIAGLKILDVELLRNVCSGGSAGLVANSVSAEVTIARVVIVGNTANTMTQGAVFDAMLLSAGSIDAMTVESNTNVASAGSGIVRIISSSLPVTLRNSQIAKNAFPTGGAVQASGALSIQRSKIAYNQSNGHTASGLVYKPTAQAAELIVTEVQFIGNASTVGGALSVTDDEIVASPVHLEIESSLFDTNLSENAGACVYIGPTVRLDSASAIRSSRFVGNHAANSCLYVAFLSGVLTIIGSEFRNNTSATYAVLFASTPASTASSQSRVVLIDSLLEFNAGDSLVGFTHDDGFAEGESRNLTVQHNRARCFNLQRTKWRDSNSVYYNNSAVEPGTVVALLYSSSAYIENVTFQDNQSTERGGAVYIGAESAIDVVSSRFLSNRAALVGGAVYTDQEGRVSITSCLFYRNRARAEGGALYFFSGALKVQHSLTHSLFTENLSQAGTIGLITANVTMNNCTMFRNRARTTAGVLLYLSEIRVVASHFYSQTGDFGTFIASPAASSIYISNTKFESGVATNAGAAIYLSSSSLQVSGSVFRNLTSPFGSAIEAKASSIVIVNSTLFTMVTALKEHGGSVELSDSSAEVAQSRFEYFYNGAIAGQTGNVTIQSCAFFAGQSTTGAGLLCTNCEYVAISYTGFYSLVANEGAAVFVSASVLFSIANSTFTHNQGSASGAVVVANTDTWISGSFFANNSAILGSGGAVALSCAQQVACSLSLLSCEFTENYAYRSGGAVVWTTTQPLLTENAFRNNTALYGADVASFAVSLGTVETVSALEVPSGQSAKTVIRVALLDHYRQVITIDNTTLADLLPFFPENTTVTGITSVVAVRGVFVFDSYSITHSPGNSTAIKVQVNGLASPSLRIPVQMRLCEAGEALLNFMCYPCVKGQYSLRPTQQCTQCPAGGQCFGRAKMAPEQGYWRSQPDQDKFWKCPNTDSCLGASEETALAQPTGICANGYFGNMCNGCESGFSRSSRTVCSRCPDRSVNIVRVVGVGIAALLLVVFVIKMSLISAHRIRSQYSIYLKIFLNYLQLVTVTSAIDLQWPTYVLELFKVQENAGNVSDQVFSFDCFISTGETDNQQKVVFVKVVILAMAPVFILAASFLFWGGACLALQRRYYLKYELVNSLVVLFFIVHPSIVKTMFDMFNCREIDSGEFWLSLYLNIRCWDRQHSRYALLVALPGVVLWGILTPAVALMILVRGKTHHLDDLNTRVRFGFLYNGYRADEYYWEFVILYRKMIIIIISVFFVTISISIQSLCVMLVLVIAFILQMKKAPFQQEVFNQLEQRAIMVATITIYCGLFFISDGIDGWSQLGLFIVILAANAYFLCFWLAKTCRASCQLVRAWLPKMLSRRVRPHTNDISSKPPSRSDLSMSVSASHVSAMQFEDISFDGSVANYHRAPRESRIIGPENTPNPSVNVSVQEKSC